MTTLSKTRWGIGVLATVFATGALAAADAPAGNSQDIRLRNSIAQNSVTPPQKAAGAAFVSGVASPQMGPLLRVASAPVPPSDDAPSVTKARYLWSQSPHGNMLERILPRVIEPGQLPEPKSEGARLATQYCVQCHYLPNPQMHTAANWKRNVERMVWRMSWANVVVGVSELRTTPELNTQEIIRFLQRYARAEKR